MQRFYLNAIDLASFGIFYDLCHCFICISWIYASVWPGSALVWHLNDLCHCYGVYRDHGSRFHSGFGMIWLCEMCLMSVIRLSSATPFVLCSLFPFVTIVVRLWHGCRVEIWQRSIGLVAEHGSYDPEFDCFPIDYPSTLDWFGQWEEDLAKDMANEALLVHCQSGTSLAGRVNALGFDVSIVFFFFVSAVWLNWFQPVIDPRSCCFYFRNCYCSVFGDGRVAHRLICETLLTFHNSEVEQSHPLPLVISGLAAMMEMAFSNPLCPLYSIWPDVLAIDWPLIVSFSGTDRYIDTSVSSISSDGAFGLTCH